MRTWRVGTISMGASLLLLGIFLLFSQLFGFDLFHIMISWWPIILIVLGLEILVFLFLSKKEKPMLTYDFLSIFFVGILGTVGIAFAVLSSTGIMDKLEELMHQEDRTFELPELTLKMNEDIKRVVLNTDHYPITVEGTLENELSMFGTYRSQSGKGVKLISETSDYVITKQKGDTLFVNVKVLPINPGPFGSSNTMKATVLIPAKLKVEIEGNHNPITLKPRTLMSDWNVDRASDLSIHLGNDSDVNVVAVGAQEISGQEEWKVTREKMDGNPYDEEHSRIKQANYVMGKGTHQIQITNVYTVNLNRLK